MATSINPNLLKALIATGVVFVVDNKVLKEPDMYSSVYYAASSGVGIYIGTTFGSSVSPYLPSSVQSITGLAERVSEIGLGVGSAFVINKYVMKNDKYGTTTGRVAAIAAADVVSSLAVDYLSGQPLVLF